MLVKLCLLVNLCCKKPQVEVAKGDVAIEGGEEGEGKFALSVCP